MLLIYNVMASHKVAMAWGLLIILILLFPHFNDIVNTVASDSGATMLEAGLLNWLIISYIVIIFGGFGFTLYYTAEELN